MNGRGAPSYLTAVAPPRRGRRYRTRRVSPRSGLADRHEVTHPHVASAHPHCAAASCIANPPPTSARSSAACAIPHVLIKQDTETSHGAIAPVAASTSAPVAPSHGTEAQGGAGSSPPATQAAVTPRKRTVHCSVCGSAGHNRSKCPSAPPPPPSPTPIPGLPGLALRDVGLCLETALEQAKALLSAAGMGQGAAEEELGSVEGRVAGAVRSVVEAAEAVARVCASTR